MSLPTFSPPSICWRRKWISCNQTMPCTVNTYSTVNNLIRRKLDRVANRHARFQINKPFQLFIYTPFESYKRFVHINLPNRSRVCVGVKFSIAKPEVPCRLVTMSTVFSCCSPRNGGIFVLYYDF